MFNRQVEHPAQQANGVVEVRRAGVLGILAGPALTVLRADFADIGRRQAGPALEQCGEALLIVSLGARLDRVIRFQSLPPEFHQIGECRIAFPQLGLRFQVGPFLLLQISEPELRDRQNLRLEALANQLAANPNPRKIRARWNVTDQV